MRRPPRSILVTGASSGLGAGLALSYAEPGVRLGLVGAGATGATASLVAAALAVRRRLLR